MGSEEIRTSARGGKERKLEAIASLYHYSDLSVEAIAWQLDMDVNTVQKIIDELVKTEALEAFVDQTTTTLENIMTRNVATLDVSNTALDAACLMTEKEIGSIVVTSDDKPFGIVTERDIIRRVGAKDVSLKDIKLGDMASRPLVLAEAGLTVEEAAGLMIKSKIRKLPVVSGGSVVGIVTITDLAMFLSPSRRPGLAHSILQAVGRGGTRKNQSSFFFPPTS